MADGAIWFDGSGEAWFRTSLECGSEVYVWYSTDEGTNGTLDLHVLDATGATVLEATFGDENHEATLHGHPGLWRLAVHSRPGFAGNGIAYLECD